MKIRLQTFLICLLCTSLSYAQRSLIDFEENGAGAVFGDCFGAGSLDGPGCFSVIENPDKSGINTTDSVGVYIEPAEGETWMGMFFDVAGDPAVFAGDSSTICADVWMPNMTDFMFKMENPGTGLNHEFQPPIANTTT